MKTDFDVVVIGGGIIGASAAQHLVSAGYDTLLVEQNDYASGTSSRTSRMHNCGFMYFAEAHKSLGRFLLNPIALFRSIELARRTMRERAEFALSSPDRVRKRRFYIPFEADGISKLRMAIASRVLEFLGSHKLTLEPRFLDAATARSIPLLSLMANAEMLKGAFSFAEYQFNWPERIVVDTIMKARAAGLDARNYTRVVGLKRSISGWDVSLNDGSRTYRVFAKSIVNAAGAWVDDITSLASKTIPRLNSGAKGVNLLVKFPEDTAGLGLETFTRRGTPFYVMPWGDLHYMGSVDSPAEASKTEFRATDAEIDQLLTDANQIFPRLQLSRSDVIYSWAGVRPRTLAGHDPLGSLEVREHDLSSRGLKNFVVFTGGLIMTHRNAGKRITKAVCRHVTPSRPAVPIDYHLHRLPDEDKVTRVSVLRAVQNEQARNLSDILRRRLSAGWDGDLGMSKAAEAARIAGSVLGWSSEEIELQVASYLDEVQRSYRPQASSRC